MGISEQYQAIIQWLKDDPDVGQSKVWGEVKGDDEEAKEAARKGKRCLDAAIREHIDMPAGKRAKVVSLQKKGKFEIGILIVPDLVGGFGS